MVTPASLAKLVTGRARTSRMGEFDSDTPIRRCRAHVATQRTLDLVTTVHEPLAAATRLTSSDRQLRVVAWNLGHQTHERPIKRGFHEAITALAPDILVLNEYVHGLTRRPMAEFFRSIGLEHLIVSSRIGRNNQVLIASRHPMEPGDLTWSKTTELSAVSNFLHAHVPDFDLGIVGVRVPAYHTRIELESYWTTFATMVRSVADRRIMFIGDLNATPDNSGKVGAKTLAALRSEKWQVPEPAGDWSFYTGSRIDHVLASASLSIPRAEYVRTIAGVDLASTNTMTRVSDHAALVVDFELDSPSGPIKSPT